MSSILSPLTLFVNAIQTNWVVSPVFQYIISSLWSKIVLKINQFKSVFWTKWHHSHTGDFIFVSDNFIWNLLVNNPKTKKEEDKEKQQQVKPRCYHRPGKDRQPDRSPASTGTFRWLPVCLDLKCANFVWTEQNSQQTKNLKQLQVLAWNPECGVSKSLDCCLQSRCSRLR